jgi:hypothetical protein
MVHPGVSAFGYHQSKTYRPVKSSFDTVFPSWFGRLKSGAIAPASINAIWSSPKVFTRTGVIAMSDITERQNGIDVNLRQRVFKNLDLCQLFLGGLWL